MVQFTKLRLTGFKSFVDPTELLIEPGLTGVVGPNGCGKSNLVEALRWVMGETSAKQMRGGEMDDVIFGGTNNRPARNIAEVVLHLDNTRRTAPAAFNSHDELEVTRRIERESGSTYKVNGREVRARDVQLLFADAATGARSTAMVSQGRVGALIGAKPTDRRGLLEEAAGITGLHSRRHEAELRLKAAEGNLERLEDVLQTLDVQLQGLRRQARQAARYRTISEQLRGTEAALMLVRWEQANAEQDAANARLRQAEAAVGELTGRAAAAAAAQAEQAARLPALRQAEAEAASALQRLVLARGELDAEERRTGERRREADLRLAQLAQDSAREGTLAGDAGAALERLEAEGAALEAMRAGEEDGLAAAQTQVAAVTAAVNGLEADLTLLTEQVAADDARRAALQRRLAEGAERLARLRRRGEELAAQRAAAEQGAVPPAALAQAEAAIAAAAAEVEAARDSIEAAETARAAAQEIESAAREVFETARAQVTRVSTEAAALSELLASGESGGFAPILDAMKAAQGFETALGAALGEDLTAPADEAAERHWRGLEPLADPPALPPGAEPLAPRITAPVALSRRLSQIGIVPDADSGRALQPALRPGQRLVSRDGAVWRWDGLVIAAGAPSAAALRLKQRNRLVELQAQRAEAEETAATAAGQFDSARTATAAAGEGERTARESLRAAERTLAAAREAQSVLAAKAQAASARLTGLAEAEGRLLGDLEEAEAQLEEAQETLAALPDPAAARDRVAAQRTEVAEKRAALMECRSVQDRLAREAQGRRQRLEAIRLEAAAWRKRAADSQAHLADLAQRIAALEEEKTQLERLPAEIAERRADLVARIEVAEATRKEAADRLAEAEAALAAADKALKSWETELGNARELRVRAEGAVEGTAQHRRDLIDRIAERLHCTPVELPGLATTETAPAEELERRLDRLQRERENLGAVNLRAEQEAAELEEQMVTMTAERDDLIAAIAKLRGAIGSLNREARERLLSSFQQVDRHFQELFVRLFAGGRAHLALTESDDPLEAGLEIMASPPGKKLQVLSLLSGGEQALTAVALLFAVFLTNPAPICVLDEVDAPLDDANVDRFCALVAELAHTSATRFLVITHHRLTMARMDRLFGVTMAERGVSQLVSVDLQRADLLRATG